MGRGTFVEFGCDWPDCTAKLGESRESRELGRPVNWRWVRIDERPPMLLCDRHGPPIDEMIMACEKKARKG